MKHTLALLLAAGLLGGAFVRFTFAQSNASTQGRLRTEDTFTSRGKAIMMTADRIDRNESMIRLRGNVEIKLRPQSNDVDVMILHADEADYLTQGDEIIPRGNVRVTLEKP